MILKNIIGEFERDKSEWKCTVYVKMQVLRLKIPLLIQYQGLEGDLRSKFLSDQTQLMIFFINHIHKCPENKLLSVYINFNCIGSARLTCFILAKFQLS